LLAAEPGVTGRTPWSEVEVFANEVNNPNGNSTRRYQVGTDSKGYFRMPLNPGQYTLGVSDPERLRGKMHSPMLVKVEAGSFTDVTVDYEKLNVRDLPQRGGDPPGYA